MASKRDSQLHRAAAALLTALALSGCGGSHATAQPPAPARWLPALHLPGVFDLTPPRHDGRLTLAAAGHLALLRPGASAATGFAAGPGGYGTAAGPEPYIALAPARRTQPGCGFGRDELAALELTAPVGLVAIDARGRVRRLANLPAGGLLNGITFDGTGRFGHRLLVTSTASGTTTVYAVDCRGGVRTLTTTAPALEGGVAVAPPGFGAFAGDLIAPDELSGRIVALAPDGRARTVVDSGLAHGGDTGVESLGFVPPRFGRRGIAYLADRASPGSPTAGTDSVLALRGAALARAGVRPGDLLAATEAGAGTIAVRCRRSCSVRHVANGPAAAHAEGHIVFVSRR